MADKFLDNIDLNRNQLLNLVLQFIAGDHSNPREGLIWYDSTAKQLAFYNGTEARRVPLTGGGGDASTVGGASAAQLRDRSTHTGTQTVSTISDFNTSVMALTAGYIDASELEARITTLIGGAPGLLDTLDELANAIGDDANFATTIQNQINARTKKASALVGNGSASTITFTHNLGTRDIVVAMYEAASPYNRVHASVQHATINAVTLIFGSAPATDSIRVTAIG